MSSTSRQADMAEMLSHFKLTCSAKVREVLGQISRLRPLANKGLFGRAAGRGKDIRTSQRAASSNRCGPFNFGGFLCTLKNRSTENCLRCPM